MCYIIYILFTYLLTYLTVLHMSAKSVLFAKVIIGKSARFISYTDALKRDPPPLELHLSSDLVRSEREYC